MVFAFLLYDFKHPDVIKVLEDNDYWNCLDAVSGDKLSVFSFHAPRLEFESRGDQFRRPRPSFQSLLNQEFKVSEVGPLRMPSLLFFQIDEDCVSDQRLVYLKATGVPEAFAEINAIFKDVTKSLESVRPEFRQNSKEIFNLVDAQLQGRKIAHILETTGKTVFSIEKWARRFAGLAG